MLLSEEKAKKIIHILRNPYGFTNEEIRKNGLDAADMIERFKGAYINMREFAERNGLDTKAYNR